MSDDRTVRPGRGGNQAVSAEWNAKICECGHHRSVHAGGRCEPWGRKDHCDCAKYRLVGNAEAGVDVRADSTIVGASSGSSEGET